MSANTRVDLGHVQEGAWADLRPVTWGVARRAAKEPATDGIAFAYQVLRSLVAEWNVRDSSGEPVRSPRHMTDEELDDLDVDVRIIPAITRAVGDRIREAFGGADAPNSGGGSPTS